MVLRDITDSEFETIADELERPVLQPGAIEVISGFHRQHGQTILVRDATRCMALVEDASIIDLLHAENSLAPKH